MLNYLLRNDKFLRNNEYSHFYSNKISTIKMNIFVLQKMFSTSTLSVLLGPILLISSIPDAASFSSM